MRKPAAAIFGLAENYLLYAPSDRHDSTYHGICYTSRRALAGTENSLMGSPSGVNPTTYFTMSGCSTVFSASAPRLCDDAYKRPLAANRKE